MKLFGVVLNVLFTLGTVLFLVWVIWNLFLTFHEPLALSALMLAG